MDKYTPPLHTQHSTQTKCTHSTPTLTVSFIHSFTYIYLCAHAHVRLGAMSFWPNVCYVIYRNHNRFSSTNKHTHTHIHELTIHDCSFDRFEKTRDKNNKTEIELKRSHWFLFLVLFSSILSLIMQIQHCFSSFYLWYYIFVFVVVVVVDVAFSCRRRCYWFSCVCFLYRLIQQ